MAGINSKVQTLGDFVPLGLHFECKGLQGLFLFFLIGADDD